MPSPVAEVLVRGLSDRVCHIPAWRIPARWRDWVTDRGSLTQRLIRAAQGDFRVRRVREDWLFPHLSEARELGLDGRRLAWVREVELLCHGEVRVRARSVVPLATLSGEERQLRFLGERPLGAFLFSSRTMRRGPMQYLMMDGTSSTAPVYGRCSAFYLHGKPLLVSEMFLPTILTLSNSD
jgi:chorismate--pyruvate lyase